MGNETLGNQSAWECCLLGPLAGQNYNQYSSRCWLKGTEGGLNHTTCKANETQLPCWQGEDDEEEADEALAARLQSEYNSAATHRPRRRAASAAQAKFQVGAACSDASCRYYG